MQYTKPIFNQTLEKLHIYQTDIYHNLRVLSFVILMCLKRNSKN